MSVMQRLVTAEEFHEMPDPPGVILELVDGEILEMAPAGFEHGNVSELLKDELRPYVRQHGLGTVLGDNIGYVLRRDPDVVRAPDVSFLETSRVPTGAARQRFVEGPPTIAVEVVSPTDRASDIKRRVRDYLDAGTRQVWMLWPELRAASVHRSGDDPRELGPDDHLDGGDDIPGFRIRIGDLFPAE